MKLKKIKTNNVVRIWDDEVLIRVFRKLEIRRDRLEVIGDDRSRAIARQANNILARIKLNRSKEKGV